MFSIPAIAYVPVYHVPALGLYYTFFWGLKLSNRSGSCREICPSTHFPYLPCATMSAPRFDDYRKLLQNLTRSKKMQYSETKSKILQAYTTELNDGDAGVHTEQLLKEGHQRTPARQRIPCEFFRIPCERLFFFLVYKFSKKNQLIPLARLWPKSGSGHRGAIPSDNGIN